MVYDACEAFEAVSDGTTGGFPYDVPKGVSTEFTYRAGAGVQVCEDRRN